MNLATKANQTTFADLIGVTQQAVSKHLQNGTLTKNGTYSQWLVEYCEHLRIEAAGRDVAEEIKEATIREKNANASKKELETAILGGTVVLMDDVFEELVPAIQHLKSNLASASEKIKGSIDGAYNINVDIRYIDDPIHKAMSEIAKIVENPDLLDDRHLARYVIHVGADSYCRGCVRQYMGGNGTSAYRLVTNEWKPVSMFSGNITKEELEANPPPFYKKP